jgi:hypothetical protein
MQMVTLQFQTPQDLAGFKKMAADHVVKVDFKELRLTCQYSLPDIAQAMNYYGAKVLDDPNTE